MNKGARIISNRHGHQLENEINYKARFIWFLVAILISAATIVYAFVSGINPPLGFLVGCLSANICVALVCVLLRVPTHLYVFSLVFVYMASPLGSILNFYRSIDFYDKLVHFISGILIAAFGWVVISKLMPIVNSRNKLIGSVVAFLFASSGAGLWEIFEYVTDILAGGTMQRGMVDTVTDMIAGNLGGVLYALARVIKKIDD